MKKYVLFLLLLAGCAKTPSKEAMWFEENGKVKVLATIAMIDDLVAQVGGEHVESIPLIRGELDPHSYELVKGDDEKFARADVIFYNGLGLEHGLSLRQNLERNEKAISVAKPVLEAHPETILVIDGQFDPHIWMDISLWAQTVEPIVATLSKLDPDHAEEFQANGVEVLEALHAADEEVYAILQAVPASARYLVTSHDAFHYFAYRYLAEPEEDNWLPRCQAPEGLAPEAQMSLCDVLQVMEHLERYAITVLFPESNVSKDSLRKIASAAKDKGWAIRLCPETLYGDSMGKAESYLEMMQHNVDVIAKEFSR